MKRLQKWSIAFALTALVIAITFAWLDIPIAFFAHDQLKQFGLFARLTRIPEWFWPLAVLAFLALGMRALVGRALSRPEAVLLLSAISLVTANAVKDQLKFIFGRTWPETWVRCGNPSLIADGTFGFNFFHGGPEYESFPSGETTAICAIMSVLWICYPRLRALYVVVVAAVAIGLIGADYHFLSDIIAGGFIGASTGWMAVVLWETTCAARLSPQVRGNAVSAVPAAERRA